jgi:hypothetical protein
MGNTNIQTTLRYQKVTSGQAEVTAQKAFEKLVLVGNKKKLTEYVLYSASSD